MNKKYSFIIFLFCLLTVACSKSMNDDIVLTATATLSSAGVYIGEEVTYTIEIISKKEIDYAFEDISFDDTENISKILSSRNRLQKMGTYNKRTIEYTLAFYDTGQFIISTYQINYTYGGKEYTVYGEAMEVLVHPFSDGDTIPPYKNVIAIKTPWYVWLALCLFIICILLLVIFIRKKRKGISGAKIASIEEHKEALSLIDLLISKDYISRQAFALYYFELTFILKVYLSKRFSLSVTEMTTRDISGLSPNRIPDLISLIKFFEEVDQIKFAKRIPDLLEIKRHTEFCQNFIKTYNSFRTPLQ